METDWMGSIVAWRKKSSLALPFRQHAANGAMAAPMLLVPQRCEQEMFAYLSCTLEELTAG
jgi:hypothetical protein